MPVNFNFQVGLELARILPVRESLQKAATSLLTRAKDLRKTGSDLVVEEDLAELFGRLHIEPNLEKQFRSIVAEQGTVELPDASDVYLEQGAGPTLSMLCMTTHRDVLASILVESMSVRYDKVPEARPDPGFDGIHKTLLAISSQTSTFQWCNLTDQVEQELRSGIDEFQFSPNYLEISTPLLLGALEAFHALMTLPHHRKVFITNEIGVITLITWAHFVLGLHVIVKGETSKAIAFSTNSPPQVIVEWRNENLGVKGTGDYPRAMRVENPSVLLLDEEEKVILRVSSDDEDPEAITAHDRHPLLGWGRQYLQRALNTTAIPVNKDDMYKEIAKHATAWAYAAFEDVQRQTAFTDQTSGDSKPLPGISGLRLEFWRVVKASKIIFDGVDVDEDGICSYLEVEHSNLGSTDGLPNACAQFIKHFRAPESLGLPAPRRRLLDRIARLAEVVALFAHVVNLDACLQIPLRVSNESSGLMGALAIGNTANKLRIGEHDIFHGIARLLSDGFTKPLREDVPRSQTLSGHQIYLYSDWGWSVYLDTVGDKDPTDVRPDLVHVRHGVPTSKRSGARKQFIRDGYAGCKRLCPDSHEVIRAATYVPRAMATIMSRRPFWASRADDFELLLFFGVHLHTPAAQRLINPPSDSFASTVPPSQNQRTVSKVNSHSDFEEIGGYRDMLAKLWGTHTTPDDCCTHSSSCNQDDEVQGRQVKLGPDAAAVVGFSEPPEPLPQKVLIYLTRGEKHLRWLAVLSHVRVGQPFDSTTRYMMVTRPDCCATCALEYTASLPGKWILVL
ncbi:MAG: hypothetical protein M1828_004007 [Chrysothrix sp. TS-e1954]|nr:MAG: hypothetical protein M1828_004007 [Chrysothrix sp. TS-e1954]